MLRLRTENFQNSQHLDRCEEEVAQLQAPCNELWRNPERTQYTRDEAYLSQKLEWMHMEAHQPESAATDSVGTGTDVTTLTEGVEPSSLVAAGARAPVHLNSSYSTACPGGIQAVVDPERLERE